MLVIRDFKLLFLIGVFWESFEVMNKHILSNFEECWWDSLILDLFGCNLLGMVIGDYFLK